MIPIARQILNVVVLVAVLWANGMAGAGTISGESIGLVANRYASYFLPAGYVFAIWSLIYLSLVAFAVYQGLPGQRTNPLIGRIGIGWAVNGALNIAWVVAFSFSLFGLALAIMVGLLLSLVWIHEVIPVDRSGLSLSSRIFVVYPFELYLAWISVALIANASQFLTYRQWSGFGLSGPIWSAIMMAVATGLSALMVHRRGSWIFPLVVAWALVGIAHRYADVSTIANTAYALTAVNLLALAWASLRRKARE